MVSRTSDWGKELSPGQVAGQRKATPPKVTDSSDREKADSTAEKAVPSRGKALTERDTRMLVGVDGRSPFARRARSVMAAFISDLGGPEEASAAERVLARRAAVLTVQLEQLEARMAEGDTSATTLDLYARGTGHLNRTLKTIGVRRRARDVSPGQRLIDLYRMEGRITDEEDRNEQEG